MGTFHAVDGVGIKDSRNLCNMSHPSIGPTRLLRLTSSDCFRKVEIQSVYGVWEWSHGRRHYEDGAVMKQWDLIDRCGYSDCARG
jgi:hypothetical protein